MASSCLRTFDNPVNAVVIGASGGIGAAFCRQLAADAAVASVYALSRGAERTENGKINSFPLDLEDVQSIADAAAYCAAAGELHLVIVGTGILHRGSLRPEKSSSDLDAAKMLEVLHTNTVGPAIVAKHFLPLMARSEKSVFAALSARVGSISDNRLGGWTSYRTSKAALNMVVKTLAIEHGRRWPKCILAALHPGTVNTALSQPFNARVPDGQLFSPEYSATMLLGVIDKLEPAQSGGFFAWDGIPIPY